MDSFPMRFETFIATADQVLTLLGAEALSGPNAPDCSEGVRVFEIKNKDAPVPRAQVARIMSNPRSGDRPLIIVSTTGFSPAAQELAQKYDEVWTFTLIS